MAFDGSGTYVRNYNWTQDAANAVPITASRFDTEHNGFAAALSICVTRDGQGKPTSDISWQSHGITNLRDPTAPQEPVTLAFLNGTSGLNYLQGTQIKYVQTAAESAASVTPTNYFYVPGHLYRYGTNTTPGTTDMSTAWANALAQAQRTGGAAVYLPPEDILVNTGISANTGVLKIYGEGWKSRIKTTATNVTPLTLGVNCSQSVLQDFQLVGPGTGSATVPGLIFNNSNTNTLRRLYISAFDKGIQFQTGANSCFSNALYDCQIISNKTINIEGQANTNALYLSNCTIGGGPCATALKLVDSGSLVVEGGDCEGMTLCVFDLDATSTLTAGHYIDGFHFESNTSSAGDVRIGNTAAVNGVTLNGCFYKPGAGNDSAVNAIRGDGLCVKGGGLQSGYTGTAFERIGASFGAYKIEDVGNYNNRITTAQALSNGSTITLGTFETILVSNTGAVTGIILPVGTFDGQKRLIVNQSGNSVTFAAFATSHVAAGVGASIPATSNRLFVWVASVSSWEGGT